MFNNALKRNGIEALTDCIASSHHINLILTLNLFFDNERGCKDSMLIESLHRAYHIPFAFLVKRFHSPGYSPVRSVTMSQPQFYVEDRAPINCVESLHVKGMPLNLQKPYF
jgi:hypothetical protein